MPWEVAAEQDRRFKKTGTLAGPLHGVVMAIKDQYDTFDLRTTSGADAQYANDRPPEDATFVKRLRDAGAIVLAKSNLAEYAVDGARSSFGGTFCNPYDTERGARHVERRFRIFGVCKPGLPARSGRKRWCRSAGRHP